MAGTRAGQVGGEEEGSLVNSMAHVTEFEDFQPVSNGQWVVIIKCCGEHEHRHTVGTEVINGTEFTDLAKSIAGAHKQAQTDHEAANQVIANLQALKGQKIEHP